jgi:hypothetical protein
MLAYSMGDSGNVVIGYTSLMLDCDNVREEEQIGDAAELGLGVKTKDDYELIAES